MSLALQLPSSLTVRLRLKIVTCHIHVSLVPALTSTRRSGIFLFHRLISYIHQKCECRQYCHVGNTANQCRLGLFQDSVFAGDLEGSKSTSGGTSCVFGSHSFVTISWMCKKKTSGSHSSTESEIISLDAGLKNRRDSCSRFVVSDCFCLETRFRLLRDWGDPLSLKRVKDLKEN